MMINLYVGICTVEELTHWGRDKMAAISETKVWNAFSWMKIYKFRSISPKCVHKDPINNIPALVQVMAWRRPGDKPLSEPMMVRLPTHICVTRPQWVKGITSIAFRLFVIVAMKSWWRHQMENTSALLALCDVVHGPEQILVPSGWAKLGNVFRVHICPVHYLSHDRLLNSAAFMWLSPMLIILFLKNNIFVFFNEFQIVFKLKPSSMPVLVEYNCSNTSWYPFRLYVSISLKKSSNRDKFMQKFLPFRNQWKIWTASLHLVLRL